MWLKFSSFIIKFRYWLLATTFLITGFMLWEARKVEMTYDFVKVVPATDTSFIYFKEFTRKFGEDGNIMVIGLQDTSVFEVKKFAQFKAFADSLLTLNGVKEIVSIPTLKLISKDTTIRKFKLQEAFKQTPANQQELDSILTQINNTGFYKGLFYNQQTNATLLAVTIDKNILNSAKRTDLINKILHHSQNFTKNTGIKLHFAGLPYVRSILAGKVKDEFILFLILAAAITSLFLFFFFRSFTAVFFTFLVILITVIWTVGVMGLFGYKMNLLTGMLPALIVVVSIPNCIYMYNKYHQEYRRHNNKIKAITRIIHKIGFLTFMTNANTAVGFFVLYFTDISILKEFGVVAGILSIATFLISIIVIPGLLFIFPPPGTKQMKHLDLHYLRKITTFLKSIVIEKRMIIYTVTIILLVFSVIGIYRIQAVSYMVDDLPERSNVKTDLAFFEKNFKGVMPLEIIIDFKKKNSVNKPANLDKIEEFDTYLRSIKEVSNPISYLNIVKGSTQAFYNNDPEAYRIPSTREAVFLMKYWGKNNENKGIMRSLVDSTNQIVRMSCKVADVGTKRTEVLVNQIQAKAKEIFGNQVDVRLTGTTLIFLKGNQYLIDDLTGSLILAFLLISLMMALIFTNVKMILISLVPNIIPMLVTAGIMGYFNIPLKPSTALIFSISFGISIDSTIHYLSKFKQELYNLRDIPQAILVSLEEAGVSMIYSSLVLFAGFIIFCWSDFGGTIALGVLTSITLFVAMITNLTLLPSLIYSFSPGKKKILNLKEAEEEVI